MMIKKQIFNTFHSSVCRKGSTDMDVSVVEMKMKQQFIRLQLDIGFPKQNRAYWYFEIGIYETTFCA